VVGSSADRIIARDPDVLSDVVASCAAVKASIVAADEREHGERAHLNYGHTFGHAIERVVGFDEIKHGEAIALGMMAAAYLAADLGRIDEDQVGAHRRALETVGLPVSRSLDFDALQEAWSHDKKYRRGVRFVLLNEIGKPEAGIEAPEEMVRKAVERLAS
jgi:shikimate kinase / 3-dehydroquinate synthase